MWRGGSVPQKYSTLMRKQVRRRLRKLLREDTPDQKILEILQSEGITRADSKPVDQTWLTNQRHMLKKQRMKNQPRRRLKFKGPDEFDGPDVQGVLRDFPMKPMVEAATAQSKPSQALTVPVSVELMLEDEDLTENEKLLLLQQFLKARRKKV